MKTTVIHHSADYDGIFCREIARKFLPDAELIGWDFSDHLLRYPEGHQVYVMDLPLDKPFGMRPEAFTELSVIWIDHHKSAIDSHPKDIPGYRIDGVAACRLAWQWFLYGEVPGPSKPELMPTKDRFIDRLVSEPMAVRLAGEYDIWDHRDDGDLELQFGLTSVDEPDWKMLLNRYSNQITDMYIEKGKIAMAYSRNTDSGLVKGKSFRLKWEGLDFLCLNTGRFNSLTFAVLDKPETGHDALLGFMWNGKAWTVSLYHANHRKDLDLSLIAVKHGGGGHRGACGFTCKTLPFEL